MFPCVYFFFPETRLRSLEEMDGIFKKSTNVFNSVTNSLNEPYRYDKHGELKPEYVEEVMHIEGPGDERAEKRSDPSPSASASA